jgi:hypothetical protein
MAPPFRLYWKRQANLDLRHTGQGDRSFNDMKYELAKALMDAGFPQGGNGTWKSSPDAVVVRQADRVYAPTLEELIEACAGTFLSLEGPREGHRYFRASSGNGKMLHGTTPTEAVARLWLALNRRNTTGEAPS